MPFLPCMMSGNEEALKVLVQHKEALSNADSRGWIPLHEAAVQHKRSILEITYAGLCDIYSYLTKPPKTYSVISYSEFLVQHLLRGQGSAVL